MKKRTEKKREKKDYSKYRMNPKEILICILTGASGGTTAFYIFFGNPVLSAVFGLIAVIFALRKGNDFFRNRRNRKLLMEFKDFLEMYMASLSAGRNSVSAMNETMADLITQYGECSLIAGELRNILNEVKNGSILEDAVSDFAAVSGIQDIKNFAETFRLCQNSGGNLKEAVSCTYNVLSEKMRIQSEIEAIVSKGKNELTIMTFMPLAVLPVMKTLGESDNSSGMAGTAVKIIGAMIIAAAYFIGRKISDIKI